MGLFDIWLWKQQPVKTHYIHVMPTLEETAALVHEDWRSNKATAGITSRKSPDGEEYMVPYYELSEAAKDLDRATVRAVFKAIKNLDAARNQ